MVKSEKEQYKKTLESVINLCSRLVDVEDEDTRTQILTNCQGAAIAIGEKLEECTNPMDIRAVNDYQIIKKIIIYLLANSVI